ncbi:MAG: hypothetical protein FWH38_05685 [Treponema sp.]|nr:hypothetical protein [Treponema sp.]
MKMIKKLQLLVFFVLFVISCETAPPVKPIAWTRTLPEQIEIEAGTTISLFTKGETGPLSGNEKFVAQRLEDYASDLLSRRGYNISDEDFQYKCIINYKTSMGSRINFRRQSTSYTSSRFSTSNYFYLGSSIFSNTTTSTITDVYESAAFLHTISVDIFDENDNLLWSGNTAWESSDLNIISHSYMVFQKLFTVLPKTADFLANIPLVREDRILEYYEHYCKDIWFTSFSLPFPIRFDPLQKVHQNPNDKNSPEITVLPNTISDGQNLAAYIDLIMMSELALPGGTVEEWEQNPLSVQLWKEAVLGGRYIIGNDDERKNILIDLRIISGGNGYAVNNCRTVTDNEFDQYEKNMAKWESILNEYYVNYYNFYE